MQKILLLIGLMYSSFSYASNQFEGHDCKDANGYGFNVLVGKDILFENNALYIRKIDRVVCVEDVVKKKYSGIWVSSNEGDQVILSFYQFDKKTMVLRKIFSTDVLGETVFSSIRMKDLDGDGVDEILVSKATFSEWGTLSRPGDVEWVDIYKFKPIAVLSDSDFVDIYRAKKIEINKDILVLEKKIKEVLRQKENTNDENMRFYFDTQINGIHDVLDVYHKWLDNINDIEKDSNRRQ